MTDLRTIEGQRKVALAAGLSIYEKARTLGDRDSFCFGLSVMWRVGNGWQVADLVGGLYTNHLVGKNDLYVFPEFTEAVAEMKRRNA